MTITGINLFGYGSNVTAVRLGGVNAEIDYSSTTNSSIRVRAGPFNTPTNTPVPITIISDTSALVQSASVMWTYIPPGQITSILPAQGQFGSMVTITGTNLLGGGSLISVLRMDGIPPSMILSQSNTQVRVQLGNDSLRDATFYPGEVFIQADTGAIVTGSPFQQLEPGMITSFTPQQGRIGTEITITGQSLTGFGDSITSVEIAGVSAIPGPYVSTQGDTELVVQAASAPVGTSGPIRLTINTGAIIESSQSLTFTYLQNGSISSLSPVSGTEGTGLLIRGEFLQVASIQIANVTIGGSEVSRIVTQSATEVSVIAGPPPQGGLNDLSIRITAADMSYIEGGSFSYQNLAVSVTGLDQGQYGSRITLTVPFPVADVASVSIDDQEASILTRNEGAMSVSVEVPRARRLGNFTTDITVESRNYQVARLRNGFIYLTEGQINSISPNEGQRGTSISIVGDDLYGGGSSISSVTIGGIATQVTSSSPSMINITIPANPSSTSSFPLSATIVIISNTGAIIQRLAAFSYVEPGTITTFSPTSGQRGTRVTISGTNLLQGSLQVSSVLLAGIMAEVVGTPTNSQIQVIASASTPRNNLVEIILSSGATVSSSNNFQYVTSGVINSVNPISGTVGTRVTIQGQNLLGGGSAVSMVMLDGTAASVSAASSSTITVIARQANSTGMAGRVEIISNTGARVSLDSSWTYQELGSITSVNPTTGQQGVMVDINGSSFLGGSGSTIVTVTLAGIPATIISHSDTSVVVQAGNSSTAVSGPIELTVDTGPVITSDTNDSSQLWSYYAASLDSVSPSSGVNGTTVMLTGLNLPGDPNSNYTVDRVTLAGVDATDIRVVTPSSIRVRVGYTAVNASGAVRVMSTSGAFLELDNAWQYEQPGVITSIVPPNASPGETVTIFGERLVPAGTTMVEVLIGQIETFSATVLDTSAVMIRPGPYQNLNSANISLPVLIEASNGATVYNSSGIFTYNPAGTVTDVSPRAGGTGSLVNIIGMGLLSGGGAPVTVYLAGIQATVLSASDTEIMVEAGSGSDLTGSVVIESNNSLQTGQAGNAWTYLPAVSVSMVSPQSGRNGTQVQIDLNAIPDQYILQSVILNGVEARIVSSVTKTVTVEAGMSSSSTSAGSITLTFQSNISLTIPNAWSYQTPTSISVQSSVLVGYYNTLVNIIGTGFQGPSGVQVVSATLAGINTTIVSQSSTQLTLRVMENVNSTLDAVTGPVILTFTDGAVFNSQQVLFTYPQLQVTSVSPSSGQYQTRVTIQGSGLLAGGSTITSFTLDGVAVSNITSSNNTEIVIAAAALSMPSSTAGDIIYELDTGAQVIIPGRWSYVAPGEVSSVDPTTGNRGTVVTISGSNMLAGGSSASTVYLGGIPAVEVLSSSDCFVQVKAGGGPMQSAGNVRIVADTGAEVTSQANLFTYQMAGDVQAITPIMGQFGTRLNISGLRFDNGDGIKRVTLAGVQADILTASTTLVTVTAQRPATLESFSGSVVIESNYGTITESNQNFTYLQEGFIATLTPSQGQRGTRLTLNGLRLLGGGATLTSATIAGTAAEIISQSNTEVVLVAGENSESLSNNIVGDVVLTSDSGAQIQRVNSWMYIQYGSISTITPSSGQYGTRITLTGTQLTAGGLSVEQIFIGDISALEVISSSPTQVVFRAGEPSTTNTSYENITLISNSGGNITTNTIWTYQVASMVISVVPVNGSQVTEVNITGTNLLGGGNIISAVSVAGIPARNILFSNDTLVTFNTGFNQDGVERQGNITLEADTGALTVIVNAWTYLNTCPVGQFGNNTNSCMPCDEQCVQCRGPTEFECFDCRNFRIVNSTHTECVARCPSLSTIDKECVEFCQTNQFQHIDLNNVSLCLNCHPQCDPLLGCSGPNNTINHCTQCRNVSNIGFCVSECPLGTFSDRGNCTPCHSQCKQMSGCSGPQPSDCNQCSNFILPPLLLPSNMTASTRVVDSCIGSCPSNYYVDSASVCRSCHPECLDNCTGPMATECGTCSRASILYSNRTRLCLSTCNPDINLKTYYMDVTNGVCQPCSSLCSLTRGCNGPSASDCNGCRNFTGNNTNESEFIPRVNRTCVDRCPDDQESRVFFYADLHTGECMRCHSECQNDCTGPNLSDCIDRESGQQAFSAGPGTIALVIIIILLLFAALIAVSVVLFWQMYRQKEKFPFTHSSNLEAGHIEMEQPRYSSHAHIETSRLDSLEKFTTTHGDEEVKVNPSAVEDLEMYTDMELTSGQASPTVALNIPQANGPEECYTEMESPAKSPPAKSEVLLSSTPAAAGGAPPPLPTTALDIPQKGEPEECYTEMESPAKSPPSKSEVLLSSTPAAATAGVAAGGAPPPPPPPLPTTARDIPQGEPEECYTEMESPTKFPPSKSETSTPAAASGVAAGGPPPPLPLPTTALDIPQKGEPEECYTEMESPAKSSASESEALTSTTAAAPPPPLPPKPQGAEEKVEKPLPSLPQETFDDDEVFINLVADADVDTEEATKPSTNEEDQENIYEDTLAPVPAAAALSHRHSSDISDPLPPLPTLQTDENLYEDTMVVPPSKDTQPLVTSAVDDLYEDTDDATWAAKQYLQKSGKPSSSQPMPQPPPSLPPSQKPPPPLPTSQKPPPPLPTSQKPAGIPPRPGIPKRHSHAPLPALPPPSSVPNTPIHRSMSDSDINDTEDLYEPIPATKLVQQPKAKTKPKARTVKFSLGKKKK